MAFFSILCYETPYRYCIKGIKKKPKVTKETNTAKPKYVFQTNKICT